MSDDEKVVPFPRKETQLTLFELEGVIFDAAYAIAADPSCRQEQFARIFGAGMSAKRERGDIADAIQTLMQTLMED